MHGGDLQRKTGRRERSDGTLRSLSAQMLPDGRVYQRSDIGHGIVDAVGQRPHAGRETEHDDNNDGCVLDQILAAFVL